MLVCMVVIWFIDWLFDGIWVIGDKLMMFNMIVVYLVIGAIIALVNMFIKFVVKLLVFLFVVLILGLLILIINVGLLEFVVWVSFVLFVMFEIDEFWWIVIWVVLILIICIMIINVILLDYFIDD